MGGVTDLLRFVNAELRQKYILHQFYILSFACLQIYAKLYPFFVSTRQHFKTTYFSIAFLSNKVVPFKSIVLCECLKCRPQLTTHALRIKVSV